MLEFFNNKKILVTGHTGFKGTWICKILTNTGAKVTGFALKPPTVPSLFEISGIEENMNSVIGDIRDYPSLLKVFKEFKPEIVIHMAAQSLVRDSYKHPRYTYETNVMGTVNVLECVLKTDSVKSILIVTTDKVYRNNEWEWGYRENDPLEGYDPYSNSKSCSELVTQSYKNSFFSNGKVAVSTVRSGNVIGGGDFSKDRIIPDCVRAAAEKKKIIIRNPNSIRPYQHVLEPLNVYLQIVQMQYDDIKYAGSFNVGPNESDCITTEQLVRLFCNEWGNGLTWVNKCDDNSLHEANVLRLDCSRIKNVFGWSPRWTIEKAVDKTIEWTRGYFNNENISEIMDRQIKEFMRW